MLLRDTAKEIAALVRHCCRQGLTSLETDKLAKLAATIVGQRMYGRLRSAARLEGTSAEQQALSIVSRLFKKSNGKPVLCDSLGEALDADDVTLFLRFQSVAVRSAKQELFQRWGENDALSARLWRSLRSALRRNNKLVLFPVESPEWVAHIAAEELRESCRPVTFEEVTSLITRIYKLGCHLAPLVKGVLSQIAEMNNCQNAIRLDHLFAGLREVVSESSALELASERDRQASSPDLQIAIERATRAASLVTNELLDRYLQADKLTPDDVQHVREALKEIIADLDDGGPAQSYYSYLSAHWDDLSEEQYQQQIRTKMEYLASMAQTTFYDTMRKELSN